MEEAVGKLTAWPPVDLIGPTPWCNYTRDTPYVPLPKEGNLDILPQKGAEVTPCGQISQLEVHQLLIAGQQVAYPIGLNRCEEPIIISLPEPLANGVSLTRGKSVYLEIDIPPSPAEEPDWKVPPIGKVSTTMITSPHKSTPQNQKERAA